MRQITNVFYKSVRITILMVSCCFIFSPVLQAQTSFQKAYFGGLPNYFNKTSDEEANFCWDGMYRGKIMDPAVFVYYIKATFTNGNEVVKKGNVSLIK